MTISLVCESSLTLFAVFALFEAWFSLWIRGCQGELGLKFQEITNNVSLKVRWNFQLAYLFLSQWPIPIGPDHGRTRLQHSVGGRCVHQHGRRPEAQRGHDQDRQDLQGRESTKDIYIKEGTDSKFNVIEFTYCLAALPISGHGPIFAYLVHILEFNEFYLNYLLKIFFNLQMNDSNKYLLFLYVAI